MSGSGLVDKENGVSTVIIRDFMLLAAVNQRKRDKSADKEYYFFHDGSLFLLVCFSSGGSGAAFVKLGLRDGKNVVRFDHRKTSGGRGAGNHVFLAAALVEVKELSLADDLACHLIGNASAEIGHTLFKAFAQTVVADRIDEIEGLMTVSRTLCGYKIDLAQTDQRHHVAVGFGAVGRGVIAEGLEFGKYKCVGGTLAFVLGLVLF